MTVTYIYVLNFKATQQARSMPNRYTVLVQYGDMTKAEEDMSMSSKFHLAYTYPVRIERTGTAYCPMKSSPEQKNERAKAQIVYPGTAAYTECYLPHLRPSPSPTGSQ